MSCTPHYIVYASSIDIGIAFVVHNTNICMLYEVQYMNACYILFVCRNNLYPGIAPETFEVSDSCEDWGWPYKLLSEGSPCNLRWVGLMQKLELSISIINWGQPQQLVMCRTHARTGLTISIINWGTTQQLTICRTHARTGADNICYTLRDDWTNPDAL